LTISVEFIASSHSPLALVDNEEFVEFVKTLNADYKIPSRQTLRNLIMDEFDRILALVRF
jgi:hypothetical protein